MLGTPHWDTEAKKIRLLPLRSSQAAKGHTHLHSYILHSTVNAGLGRRSTSPPASWKPSRNSTFSASALYLSKGHLHNLPCGSQTQGITDRISGGGCGQEEAWRVPWVKRTLQGKKRRGNWWVYLVHTSESGRAGQPVCSLIDPRRACGRKGQGDR